MILSTCAVAVPGIVDLVTLKVVDKYFHREPYSSPATACPLRPLEGYDRPLSTYCNCETDSWVEESRY